MHGFIRNYLAVGAVALMMAFSAVPAGAQGMGQGRPGSGPGPGWMGMHGGWMMGGPGMMGNPMAFLRGLNLTDQQKQEVRTIIESHKAEMESIFKESIEAQKALSDDLYNGDTAALEKDFTQASNAELNSMTLRARIWDQIKAQNILTPDQMTQLQQRKQTMDQHFQNMLNRLNQKPAAK